MARVTDNIDLGTACGKLHRVCVLAITDPGAPRGGVLGVTPEAALPVDKRVDNFVPLTESDVSMCKKEVCWMTRHARAVPGVHRLQLMRVALAQATATSSRARLVLSRRRASASSVMGTWCGGARRVQGPWVCGGCCSCNGLQLLASLCPRHLHQEADALTALCSMCYHSSSATCVHPPMHKERSCRTGRGTGSDY